MDKLTMQISGMTCGHCVAGVTRALKGVPGVTVDHVVIGTASVEYDANTTTPTDIAKAVEEEGYRVVTAA
ncbi:heavy-metal-associated domain-containing protein [Gemmatimonas groenlandica]|uniref:Heavy-metal-associated domain-containing protein n=1 Tax=Gemmatimonas groenlandica TaxID=2732249 RepID=A0A6M4IU93_9BACT|nr:heavy-metal-associated domain-containing protein [Gemmatimonas groenlandica]QJR37319.1 heavy-metal-associated domain-containing protein [Gemmatimonas groenlandica]